MYRGNRDYRGGKEFMSIENLSSIAATIGGGFLVGILIGYALKKVVKILAIVIGLFFAGLAYLQYQQIVNINWIKLQATSENAITTLTNATTQISDHISNVTDSNNHTTAALAISNFGIPLTGSMAIGFALGFLKG
ncbi:MAG: hypothetical protein M3044_04420 [Thermoproteota archaeon]|nr:hypothetical protein [Thermoproteota archaeon]